MICYFTLILISSLTFNYRPSCGKFVLSYSYFYTTFFNCSYLGSYLGCYKDNTTQRDMPELLKIPDLTVDYCMWNCANLGYAYAGLQYS